MKLTLGFSPCPNDTFIFDALVNGRIDTGEYSFDVHMADVQELNELARTGKLDCTKISYGSYPLLVKEYMILPAGSALGEGVGPLLISGKEDIDIMNEAVQVALPGENTTASLLFNMAYPDKKNKLYLRYDKIEDFVMKGNNAGVIIHENRFTYAAKGLKKLADLGEMWEYKMHIPIPLGGIVARRDFGNGIASDITTLIRKSLEFAWQNYPELSGYVKTHAQEMSEDVMRKHIRLYVNDYTADLGTEGKEAIMQMMTHAGIDTSTEEQSIFSD